METASGEPSGRTIKDVDGSDVLSSRAIQSPVFGPNPPTQLSDGSKRLYYSGHNLDIFWSIEYLVQKKPSHIMRREAMDERLA